MVALPDERPSLRFEILGRTAAWRDGRELDLGPGKQRAVLAVLLLTPNRPVSTTSIVRAVWGDEPPDNGANVVQKYVAGLRRALEPDRSPRAPGRLLTLTGAGYALNVPDGGLDAEVFQDRVRAAQAVLAGGDGAHAEAMLREALAMWRGQALAGLNGSFFDAARDRLEETRAAGLEACAEAGLESGEHARLVPELLRLVAEFPLREGFRYLLMLALYRCGRQAEALAAYRDARDFFADEFGVEPGERLQNLHLGILRSDPSLAAPTASEPPEPVEAAVEAGEAGDDPHVPSPGFVPPDPPLVPRPAPAPSADVIPSVPMAAPAPPASGPLYGAPAVGAVAGHHFAGKHAAWPTQFQAGPAGRRMAGPLRAGLLVLPMISFGVVTWALIAYYAGRRRSRRLAVSAAGYLVLWIGFFVGATSSDPEQSTVWDGPILTALLVTMFGGAVHLAILTADAHPAAAHGAAAHGAAAHGGGGVPALDVQLIERRARREQARSLAAHHPSIARRLGIGRPDLPRTFDDGGLVDVNSAPEHLLASLPGVDPYHAKLIVLARTAHGPLVSVDDLATREILPYQALYAVRDMLIAVPPATDAEPVEPASGT
ncbi:BTAD domain-containing putative transcriptional regulator [Actinomadura chokoriensis]|uniref:BTAD domain-containing putative transcriptional regulator n=1 Tax=Actinomadura chokoriensis TaxID=454156 RepID=A0ABV4R0P8_9ACTN